MTASASPDATAVPRARLGPLTVYSYYRIFLAGALLLLFLTHFDRAERLGSYAPTLYLIVSSGYFFVALFSSLFIAKIHHHERIQAAVLIAIDIIALTLLAHASGGPTSAITPLLIIVVAAGAILLPGRLGFVIAAAATLAMFYEQFYLALKSGLPLTTGSTQVGLLGLAFFGIAFAANQMTRRLQTSEALAHRRAEELLELQHLNAHIIQRMRTGILVVDATGTIKLANSAGQQMLHKHAWQPNTKLDAINPELHQRVLAWTHDNEQRFLPLQTHADGPEIATNMTNITLADKRATLIFMENMTSLAQHLQQIKLASLGRLTASIAHEIRNPLAAISHGAQLLQESTAIHAEDRRLSDIIQQQTQRLDRIVDSVLKLSRREVPNSQLLTLPTWLEQFRQDYLAAHPNHDEIAIQIISTGAKARFDPHHLYQILQNLCDNGLRHGRQHQNIGKISLEIGIHEASELPFLRIRDNGLGIPAENAAHLFEPFFTTEAGGTGLGLYISRELCEANRARLTYTFPGADHLNGFFQITFVHPGRIAH